MVPSYLLYFAARRSRCASAKMAYLETLATRFVDQDGLSVEEQEKIITDAAHCQ